MKRVFASIAAVAVAFAGLCTVKGAAMGQSAVIPITDTGAVGDGVTLNTEAIQKAIDKAASLGGGTVNVPKGVFRTGAVFLKAGVNLHLEEGGVLKGSTDIKDYPKLETRIEGHFQQWIPAMINADHMDHLRITGEGTLDGSGQPFWTEFWTRYHADKKTKNLDVERPRLIYIANSKDVQVTGIHLLNSGFWNLHLYNCRNVLIEGLHVRAGETSPSTDGTDIDSSQDVTIRNCTYDVDDDCIALKGTKGPLAMQDKSSPPVEHIRISNCTFIHGQGVVTLGSEATVVRDVVVNNITVSGKMPVVRLKLRTDTPQDYEDLHFSNITGEGDASLIEMRPWTQYFDLQGHAPPSRTVSNVTISNVKGKFESLGIIKGNKDDTIKNITLENIDIQVKEAKPTVVGVENLVVKNVKLNGKEWDGPAGGDGK